MRLEELRAEIRRKTMHLSSLWMPLMYLWLDRPAMLWLLGTVGIVVLAADIGRYVSPRLRVVFLALFGGMLRPHERDGGGLTGASYMLVAAFLSVLIFSQPVAITALLVMVISDIAAVIGGKMFAPVRRVQGKTLHGSLAFFASALLLVTLVWAGYSLPLAFMGWGILASLMATLAEKYARSLHLDDNFLIPLAFGAAMLPSGI